MLVALQFYMTYSKIPSSPKGDESMSTKYSAGFKKETIQGYEKGVSIKVLSQELGVSQSTIYYCWYWLHIEVNFQDFFDSLLYRIIPCL